MIEGVRVGSRLDMLRALLRRVEAEIRAEERVERARQKARIRKARATSDADKAARLAELGVTPHDVKVWAYSQGLIPAVVRGRVSAELVDAYTDAHPEEKTP